MNHTTVIAHGAPGSFMRRVQEDPHIALDLLRALERLLVGGECSCESRADILGMEQCEVCYGRNVAAIARGNEKSTHRADHPIATKQCTCLGTCRGSETLGEGWHCVMEKCPRCEGTGTYNTKPCSLCNGTGLMSEAVKSADGMDVPDEAFRSPEDRRWERGT